MQHIVFIVISEWMVLSINGFGPTYYVPNHMLPNKSSQSKISFSGYKEQVYFCVHCFYAVMWVRKCLCVCEYKLKCVCVLATIFFEIKIVGHFLSKPICHNFLPFKPHSQKLVCVYCLSRRRQKQFHFQKNTWQMRIFFSVFSFFFYYCILCPSWHQGDFVVVSFLWKLHMFRLAGANNGRTNHILLCSRCFGPRRFYKLWQSEGKTKHEFLFSMERAAQWKDCIKVCVRKEMFFSWFSNDWNLMSEFTDYLFVWIHEVRGVSKCKE